MNINALPMFIVDCSIVIFRHVTILFFSVRFLKSLTTPSRHTTPENHPYVWAGSVMKLTPMTSLLVLVCVTTVWASPLAAQTATTGQLTGTVNDSTGALIPGVEITAAARNSVWNEFQVPLFRPLF